MNNKGNPVASFWVKKEDSVGKGDIVRMIVDNFK
jgi:hypothetical protein